MKDDGNRNKPLWTREEDLWKCGNRKEERGRGINVTSMQGEYYYRLQIFISKHFTKASDNTWRWTKYV